MFCNNISHVKRIICYHWQLKKAIIRVFLQKIYERFAEF